MGSTNWGINFLVEEAIIPEIVHLAEHCENFAIRGYGTSFQVHDEMSVLFFFFSLLFVVLIKMEPATVLLGLSLIFSGDVSTSRNNICRLSSALLTRIMC